MADELERGRALYIGHAWTDAYASLSRADESGSLGAEDLVLLATSAFMLGRDDDYLVVLERAHHAYLDAGDVPHAVRCAFWIGITLVSRGELGPGGGWLSRAERLLERGSVDSVERGYLLMPRVFQLEAAGDFVGAAAVAAEAVAIAECFGDADGFALAGHARGKMLIKSGRVKEGLALLDETMVAVTAGELSPEVTGIIYCSVILSLQEVYEVRRAREWTAALTRWCKGQPDLMAFTGRCLVHRAEILQLEGSWPDALEEAQKARERFFETMNEGRVGFALYREAELHRLLGQFDDAEEAYREASRYGWEPQPGLAQLRLAQGRTDAALSTIRRVLGEATDPLKRAGLLPAYVEIVLAVGDVDEARSACRELEEIAARYESAMLGAIVAYARGAVHLAEADAQAALGALRAASVVWQELEAPYDGARTRVLVGIACRALGDEDAARLELDAARAAFAQLGAAPDVARVDELAGETSGRDRHGLTQRELQVLRLVAAGKSNREIAATLVISEHTVARHVQNIFAKVDVSSRAAAGAFAFEHDLV
ncbi:MAG: LuxR C-terminal-related transcriptional regulator [Actinomycetota bacterium]|nr:LuxR C-terminal-related transcriptional regulator [Actinomycetota bacterium]